MRSFIALTLCLLPLCVNAADFIVDGVYYNITSSTDNTCQITYNTTSYNSYAGKVVIPEEVTYNGTTYSVTSIGNNAFRASSALSEVTIPTSVTSIGTYAFYNCTALHNITIPNNVKTIGSYAFSGCI